MHVNPLSFTMKEGSRSYSALGQWCARGVEGDPDGQNRAWKVKGRNSWGRGHSITFARDETVGAWPVKHETVGALN